MQMIPPPLCRNWRRTKKPLDESERGEWFGLKLNIQKTKIMAYGPITSSQIDGETMETVRDFIFGGSQITIDSDCSHEFKRCLLLGRRVMTTQQHITKHRYYFANKGPSSRSYDFSSAPVWMWDLDCKENSVEELMLLNCGVGEDSWQSLVLQGDPTSPS